MILAKLIATLEIRKIAAAARVNARMQGTLLVKTSITVESFGCARYTSLGWGLPRSPCRLGHDLIGVVHRGLGFRHVFADAGQAFQQRNLLVGRQTDQFAAAIDPGLARLVEQVDRLRIDRNRLAGAVLVDDLL